ncbi:ABC transporter ATP-binding protein [Lawsonibacter sp. JLR.KK007]|uniref:ABC transporter ATP-binding protein n=1 Tax=Lawsonibacter sp. JLR.KK007 TaxID=3114293 RepID=UPI002FF3811F
MGKISRILAHLEPEERTKLYRYSLLSLVSPAVELFSASLLVPIFTRACEGEVTAKLLKQVVFMGVLLLLIGGFELWKSRTATELVMDIAHSWSTRIYELYTLEDVGGHNGRTSDQARAGARYDVTAASELITTAIRLAVNVLMLAAYFCVLICIARGVGAVSCGAVVVMLGVLYQRNHVKAVRLGSERRRLEIQASGILSAAYSAYKELKIDARRDRLLEKYTHVSMEFAQAQKNYAYVVGFQGIVLENMMEAGLFFLLALVLAAGADISQVLPGAMVFLVLLLRMIPVSKGTVDGLTALNFGRKCMDEVLANLGRYQELKRAEEERERLRVKRVTLKEGIRVRGLTFRYPGGPLILDQADMDVPAGESTVVIGPSGEGKTTFLDLILGLLHPEGGHIWYDDYDIVDSADGEGPCRTDLGELVSYIPQIIYLDNDTVRGNVVFMAEEGGADEERVTACLKHAQIWEDVCQMPDGLDTVIGENGTAISGGQRQRIALARALYKQFEILIMDEATAALDMETEQAVLDAIREVKGDKTLLMVTHHMSLADACEHVYRIEDRKLRKVR